MGEVVSHEISLGALEFVCPEVMVPPSLARFLLRIVIPVGFYCMETHATFMDWNTERNVYSSAYCCQSRYI